MFSDIFRVKNSNAQILGLPSPTELLSVSDEFSRPVLRGIKLDEANPFKFEFILDKANIKSNNSRAIQEESQKLIKYFLTALTVSKKDLWVNLSPYEHDRIVPDSIAATELGENMLAQDYILKQLASSLTHPDRSTGKNYWHSKQANEFNNKQASAFDKVWIVPGKTEVYENQQSAFITEAKLDLLSEQDYFAQKINNSAQNTTSEHKRQIKELLPVLEREVNEGKHFAELRQIYYSLILGTWFKQKFMDSFFKYYINQNKLSGIEIEDSGAKERIWKLYCRSFDKGVYKVVKKYDKGKRTVFASGGCTMTNLGFTAVPLAELDEKRAFSSSIGELSVIDSNFFAYDGQNRIVSSSISSEEKIERALESSRALLRTDDVLALDTYLFNKAKEDGTKYVYVSLRSQQQLDALSKLITVKDGDYEQLDGPVYDVIRNGGVILLDYDNSHPALIEGFNSLFDENPFYKDIENVSQDLKVIAAMKEEKKSLTDSNGFLDLDTTARSRFVLSDKISLEYSNPIELIASFDDESNVEVLEINLDSAPDYESVLIGAPNFTEDGDVSFEAGILQKIMENKSRIEKGEAVLPIVIKGDCWENPEFLKFMQQLILKREFYFNGELRKIPSEIEFIKGSYDYAQGINNKEFLALSELESNDERYLINKKTQDILFGRRFITDNNKNAQLPGLLENSELKIQVVEKLDKWVWDRILHSDCKVQIELAPGVVVPKVYRDFVDKKVKEQKHVQTNAKSLEQVKDDKSFLLVGEDSAYMRYKLIEQYGSENLVFQTVTPFTDKTQLFETIKVKRQDNKYNCELIKQQLLDDLQNGKTIVLENLDSNEELYDDLITIFSQRPYLILNGQRYNLDAFSGRIVGTCSRGKEMGSYLEYAELETNTDEQKKIISDYFPSLSPLDIDEIIELGDFFKEMLPSPKQKGLYPEKYLVDFSRIMLYCKHLSKSNDKLKAFEDVFASSYYGDSELYYYMRTMARIKLNVREPGHDSNAINGKKLFELLDEILDKGSYEKVYWQVLDSLSLVHLKLIHELGASFKAANNDALDKIIGPALLKYALDHGDDYDVGMDSMYFSIGTNAAKAADEIEMSLDSFHEFDQDRMAHVRKVLDMFGAVFLKGSPGTGKSYIASELAKEMGFRSENVVGPITTGSDTNESDILGSVIRNNDSDFEFKEEALALWVPEMSYKEAQERDGRLLIVDEANLADEQLWNILNGFFSNDSQQRYIWINGRKRYFNKNDRLIFTGNQETLEGRVYSELIQNNMITVNFEDYTRDFYKKRLDEYLSNAKGNREELIDLMLDVHTVFTDINKSKVFSLRDVQEFARRLNKFTDSKWDIEEVLYQAWKQYYPQFEPKEVKALSEIFRMKYGVNLEQRHSQEIKLYIDQNYEYFKQRGIILTKSSAELAISAENFLDIIDEPSLSQIQGKRALFFQGASGRGKDLLLEAILDRKYSEKDRKLIRINVSGDTHEFTEAVKEAQRTGSILLAKEMNHLPSAFVEGKLNDVLTGQAHPGFALFATMNTPDFGACEQFSTAMYNRSLFHRIEDYPQDELETIFKELNSDIDADTISYLVDMHCWIRDKVERLNKKPTTRDIRNALKLYRQKDLSIEDAINKVYGDYYLNGLLKNIEKEDTEDDSSVADQELIDEQLALFTKKDFEDSENRVRGYEKFYKGKFGDLLKTLLNKRSIISYLSKYPYADYKVMSQSDKDLIDALELNNSEYLDDLKISEVFAVLLSLRASNQINSAQLDSYNETLKLNYNIDMFDVIESNHALIAKNVFSKQQGYKAKVVAIEAILELKNTFDEIVKLDYDEKATVAAKKMNESFKQTFEKRVSHKEQLSEGFRNFKTAFDKLAGFWGNKYGTGALSKASAYRTNPFLTSSDVNIADKSLDHARHKMENQNIYARSNASAYLLRSQKKSIDPINGKYKGRELNYSKYNLPQDKKAIAFVTQKVVEGDNRTQLFLPPGYVIASIETEKDAGKIELYYDETNQAWLLENQIPTGEITIGLSRNEKDLSDNLGIEIFDFTNGKALSRTEALEQIKESIPSYVWDYLQKYKDADYYQKTAAKDRILASFYYTRNPVLNDKAESEGNFLKYAFKYMTLLCDGFCMLDATLSYVLDMPIVVESGNSSHTGEFSNQNSHAWVRDEKGLREPTALAYENSIFTDRFGITDDMLREEMKFIENSAKAKRNELKDKISTKEETNELVEIMQSVKEEVEDVQEEDIKAVVLDAELSVLTEELKFELDELLEDLYQNTFVVDPESQKWDVTGKMDIMRFLHDPIRCCYRSSNSENVSAREVVLLGELSDKGWNPILEEIILYMLDKGFSFRVDANKVIGENSTDKLKDLARIKETISNRKQSDEDIVNDFFDNNKGNDEYLFIKTTELQKRFEHLYLQKAIQTNESELDLISETDDVTDDVIEEEISAEKQKEINLKLYESEKAAIDAALIKLVDEGFITQERMDKAVEVRDDGSVELSFFLADIGDASKLNVFNDFKSISSLNLSENSNIYNLDKLSLGNIRKLKLVQSLSEDVKFVNNFPNLEDLSLSFNHDVKNYNLIKLKKLKRISITSSDLGDISFLNNFKTLEYVNIAGNSSVEGLDDLELPNLRTFIGLKCDLDNIKFLEHSLKLKSAILNDNPRLEDVSVLLNLKHLAMQNTDDTAVSEENKEKLGELVEVNKEKLKRVEETYQLEKAGIDAALSKLVDEGYITDEQMNNAIKVNDEGTVELDFSNCNLTDASFLNRFQHFKSITGLVLYNNSGIDGFYKMYMPNILKLDLAACELSDVGFLNNFPNVEDLDLSGNTGMVGLDDLSLPNQIPNVKKANFQRCKLKSVSFLNAWQNLEELNLANNEVGVGLNALVLPKLKKITLRGGSLLFDLGFLSNSLNLEEVEMDYVSKVANFDVLFELKNLIRCEMKHLEVPEADIEELEAIMESNKKRLKQEQNNDDVKEDNKEETAEEIFEREKAKIESILLEVFLDNNLPIELYPGVIVAEGNEIKLDFRKRDLRSIEFLDLFKDFKSITSIDLRHNSQLRSYSDVEMPYVKSVYLGDRQHDGIFLVKFVNLENLYINSNKDTHFVGEIKLDNLKSLTIDYSDDPASYFVDGSYLNSYPKLKCLSITGQYVLGNVEAIELPELEMAVFNTNSINGSNKVMDISYLKKSPKLRYLELNDSQVIPGQEAEIQSFIYENIKRRDGKEETAEEIFEREKNEIESLLLDIFSEYMLPHENFYKIVDAKDNSIKLDFRNCGLRSIEFLDRFKDFQTVTSIDLRENRDIREYTNTELPYVKTLHLGKGTTDYYFVNKFANLENLYIENNMDTPFVGSLKLNNLRTITLDYSDATGDYSVDGSYLNSYPKLQHLSITGKYVLGNVDAIELPELETADFNTSGVNGSNKVMDISYLKKSPKLRYLELNDSQVEPGQEEEIQSFIDENIERIDGKEKTREELFKREKEKINNALDELLAAGTINAEQRRKALKEVEGNNEFKLNMHDWDLKDVSIINKFTKFKTIFELDLSGNSRIKNWKELKPMPSLEWLYLQENKINDVSFLKGFDNLKRLHLSGNKIRKGWQDLDMPLLHELRLENCALKDVAFLNKFTNLVDLDIHRNRLLNVAEVSLPKLKTINLHDCNFKNKEFLKRHKTLTELNLGYNTSLPALDDLELPDLEELNLWGCKIKDVSFVSNFKKIKTLLLNDNKTLKKIDNLKIIDTLIEVHGLKYTSVSQRDQDELEEILEQNKLRIENEENNEKDDQEESPEELLTREKKEINDLLDYYVRVGALSQADRDKVLMTEGNDSTNLLGEGKLGLKFNLFTGNIFDVLEHFKDFKSIDTIHLALNNLTSLEFKEDFPYVKSVVLGLNKLKDISGIKHFKNIEYISLHNNEDLKDISELFNLKYLVKYHLNNTNISPADLVRMGQLIRKNSQRLAEETNSNEDSEEIEVFDEDLTVLEAKVLKVIVDLDLAASKVKATFIENGEEEKLEALYRILDTKGIASNLEDNPTLETKGGIDFNSVDISNNSAAYSRVIDIPFDLANFKGFVFEISSIQSLEDIDSFYST